MKFEGYTVLAILFGLVLLTGALTTLLTSDPPCADLTVHTGREVKEHAGICYVKTPSGWVPRENWLVVESE